ncbi:acetyltransferase, ribosomal protein N-acetylase [Mycobacterium sp. JS623]|uniref:N-acetylglutamate synthase, CG3035 family n=1 Tax=Mycobacterium sp. JS623 TaxID=212767 RepID=UPI0002A59814|nr:GNAT family N-acetyltransferase [Mycobacterium sp. JS623]AGB20907.1 acetyltransferase, ribosomal protein N-acetylase [Mycobacterium sp. JS623]
MVDVGARVVVRYRLPAGSVPPLTDVIGHLEAIGPTLTVRTKRGEAVDISADDVVTIKALAAAPVRTGDIRNLEHAAALAWPGVDHSWVGGWLLRFGHGITRRANSAVPLDVSGAGVVGAVIDWYAARGVAPLVAAPDRLLRLPPGVPTDAETVIMSGELDFASRAVDIAGAPDDDWLRLYRREVPVDVLTAVIGGVVAFASAAGAAVGRAAVTEAPDGTRWVGLSAVHVVEEARRRGLARDVCAALLAWGGEQGATRAYVQVLADNTAASRLYESMGFSEHHRSRYVDARSL